MAIRITPDYEGAELMLRVLERIEQGQIPGEEELDRVLQTDAYQTFLQHHNRFKAGTLTGEHWRTMVRGLASGDWDATQLEDPTRARLERMHSSLQGALGRTGLFRRALSAFAATDLPPRAAEDASRYLPEGLGFECKFYLLLDGMSNGYALPGRFILDLLQMPITDQGEVNLDRVKAVLAHELHHLGVAELERTFLARVQMDSGRYLALEFVGGWLGEGSATHLLTMVTPESGSEAWACWNDHLRHLEEHYRRGETLALRLLEGLVSGDEAMAEIRSFFAGGLYGPAYVMGAEMVRTILEVYDLDSLIACLEDPRLFVKIYNEAARSLNHTDGGSRYIFDRDLADGLWNLGTPAPVSPKRVWSDPCPLRKEAIE